MPGIKELRTRIKSIQGMRKVTKAMQMVSAAKMRKAQTAVVNSRTYASLAWELVENLEANLDAKTATRNENASGVIPESRSEDNQGEISRIQNQELDAGSESGMTEILNLLQQFPKAKKVGVILLSTNRGLVGSLNSNLIPMLKEINGGEVISELVVYGKQAQRIIF